jgi:hypothetical protein
MGSNSSGRRACGGSCKEQQWRRSSVVAAVASARCRGGDGGFFRVSVHRRSYTMLKSWLGTGFGLSTVTCLYEGQRPSVVTRRERESVGWRTPPYQQRHIQHVQGKPEYMYKTYVDVIKSQLQLMLQLMIRTNHEVNLTAWIIFLSCNSTDNSKCK